MSEQHKNLSQKGRDEIVRETREAIKPVIKKLTEKFAGLEFSREEFAPAIKKGIDEAKENV